MNTFPKNISEEIREKSRRDCIEDSSKPFDYDQSIIPEELYKVLENNVTSYPVMSICVKQYYNIISNLKYFNNLKQDNYWFVWKLLLFLEYYQRIKDMEEYKLENQEITKSKLRPKEFIIKVPGLSEKRPSVALYDRVEIYQINGKNNCKSKVKYVGQNYVTVDVTDEFRNLYINKQKYNINFYYPDRLIKFMNAILDIVKETKLIPMLFPKHCDNNNNNNNINSKLINDINWIDNNIKNNAEQKKAIENILKKTSQSAPYILFGPPGTGKTSTLIETICQIIRINPTCKILICTPSNAAADEIAIRIQRYNLINEKNIYRMYGAQINKQGINKSIKSISNCVNSEIVFIPKDIFITKNIVITTLGTCSRLYDYKLLDDHFSYIFVDEAGQATELETLIPLVLSSSIDANNVSKFCGQIVMTGDPKQLGPIIQSKIAEPILGKSMLERLMDMKLYQKNNSNLYNNLYVTKLIRNYRCHEKILHIPNILFYDGELIAEGGCDTTKALNWQYLPNKIFPIIFHSVIGKENREIYSPSVYNESEIIQVIDYVKKLLNSYFNNRRVLPEDIGIITPYKLQKTKIDQRLHQSNLNNITVGTVETFQGKEKDIIIISTVRSQLYKTNDSIHIGFLSNPKRFNVAITRAKCLLIVIGDPQILQHDRYWKTFIKYCLENNACTGNPFILNDDKEQDVSQLLGKKHIPIDTNKNYEYEVDEDPQSSLTYEPPVCDENRRRRFPICYDINQYYHDICHVNTSFSQLKINDSHIVKKTNG